MLAGLVVFTTSAAILILEILAARLLAPYVGVTLETYTAIIGTVLAGIAMGNALGGRAADRVDPRRLLGPLLVAGGALSLATIPFVRAVGETGEGAGEDQAILLAAVGFFLPAAVLSAVTPTVVKLRLHDLGTTGKVVGYLSALGTAGALVGTFVAGFVLVEAAATTTSITAVGTALVVAGIVLWLVLSVPRRGSAAALVAVAIAGGGLTQLQPETCHVETTYHCARVEPDPDRAGGLLLRLDTLRHSYVDLDDPDHLEFRYTRVFADAINALTPRGALDVTHIGGGGFTMPRFLASTRAGTTSTVLEIDGRLVGLVRDRLGLAGIDGVDVRIGDGRLLLSDVREASQDVVIGDAFGGLAVPWHLTTIEAIADVRRTLRPDGIYVANVIDYPPLRFARAELRTLAEVFPFVAVLAPADVLAGDGGGNVVLVGSLAPIDGAALEAEVIERRGIEDVLVDADALAFAGGVPVLRDDYAPVDQWLANARR